MSFIPSRLTALLLVAGLSVAELGLLDVVLRSGSREALAQGVMTLRIRRAMDGVEVVLEGVGTQPVLQQRLNGSVWEGRLKTQGARGINDGFQQLSDPSVGLQRVAVSGSGNEFIVRVIPVTGQVLSEPVVSADGRNLILQFHDKAKYLVVRREGNLLQSEAITTSKTFSNAPTRVKLLSLRSLD